MNIPARLSMLLLGAVLTASACDPFTAEDFIIQVSDIAAPDSIASGQPLEVRFFGLIGADQCAQLNTVERRTAPGLLEVRFHGRREGKMCLQTPSQLEHREVIQPPLQDPFIIRVLQPVGEPLERIVRVR
jgi:hypothetical protein